MNDKTVVALASAPEASAIGVIQLAGPNANVILERHAAEHVPVLDGMTLTTLRDDQDTPIDQVLISCLSETPPVYEITCHGGLRIVQRIIETFQQSGAERLDAGELIATVHRLTDDIARDAYALLPHAKTTLAAKFLLAQADGGLSKLFASTDRDAIESALAYWPVVRALIDGVTAVVVGPANAGKSTLFNYLVRHERALVADCPGTTRDYVRTQIDLAGVPVTLIDTAGLGATDDVLADRAREKTIDVCRQADLAVMVLDASNQQPLTDQLAETSRIDAIETLVKRGRAVITLNKVDRRPDRSTESATVSISALTGMNIGSLESAVLDVLGLGRFDPIKPCPFTAEQAKRLAEVLATNGRTR